MEDKVRQLISTVQNPLNFLKSEIEEFPNDYKSQSLLYNDIIKSLNIIKELKTELEKLEKTKFSSKKFKQQKLFK
jgi:hypothetical protein